MPTEHEYNAECSYIDEVIEDEINTPKKKTKTKYGEPDYKYY